MNQIIKIGAIVAIAAVLVASGIVIGLGVSGALTPRISQRGSYTYGPGMMGGSGMMGGYTPGEQGFAGPGMMDEFSYGPMIGSYVPDPSLVPQPGQVLSLAEAVEVAEAYVHTFDDDLEVAEVMQFSNHFYAEVGEESTGMGAFELLIDPHTAAVIPEFGPNMMWNAKYGHMGGGMMGRGMGMMGGIASDYSGEMAVTSDEALELANNYLDSVLPDTYADDPEPFYGYYTLHTLGEDGEITGMLSVNGSTGQVWPHTWHGEFIDMVGHDEG